MAEQGKEKSKVGRKPMFTPERVEAILDSLRKGDSDEVAAKIGGISKTTFYEWQNTKPEFADAVKSAKADFEQWTLGEILTDARRGLKVLVCGTEYEEVKTEYEQDPRNPSAPRIKKQTRQTKKILPNATAVIFALCNRDPDHWQNRVSQELSGKIETEQSTEVSLANVPDSLLEQVIDAIYKKRSE